MRTSRSIILILILIVASSMLPVGLASAQSTEAPEKDGIAILPTGDLTLEQAISAAFQLSPSRKAATYAVSAAQARVTQAGLLPNPELSLETENFGGSGNLDGFNAAESTLMISQPILLGGKISRRRAVAESDQMLATRDLEAIRLDVVVDATSAFYRVLAAQRREALAGELLRLAERFASTVQARVDAGKVSPVEATRASIEVAQARVLLIRAVRELEAAKVRLAATWGSSTATFDRAVGELPEPTPPPSLQQLRSILAETPEIQRLENLIRRREQVLELERSFRIPDVTVSLGPRRFEETGKTAWVAGVSLPVPIFDRNQGARQAAEFEIERARRDAETVRVALETEVTAIVEPLQAAAEAVTAFQEEVVPAASSAFSATETGYREGKFSFLEVLDAQRALFEARSVLLDNLEEYATTRARLERLIGQPAVQISGVTTFPAGS